MINFVKPIRAAFNWLDKYSTHQYVQISSKNSLPYNEVTGYFIPTLLNYGFRDKALSFANYLSDMQLENGSWVHSEDKKPYVFDTAQIIDGLSEFGDKYSENIKIACNWACSQFQDGKFIDAYGGSLSDHIYLRVIYCLAKAGVDVLDMMKSYTTPSVYKFDTLSHFYGYAFEGAARLGLDCGKFLEVVRRYNGLIPEKSGLQSYCFVGLSQIALALFLIREYDMGMKALEFVTGFQNQSGGFNGSNGLYFKDDELSWAVKFYLDAFHAGQKLWFVNNLGIFQSTFEKGDDKDERLIFVRENIKEQDKVLDVGCGKGRYINRLNCDRYACDIADASKYVNAKFEIGSCLRLPYKDESFNVVFCAEVIEHAIFHENAVKECLRVLKPGGKLMIIDKDKKIDFKHLHFGEEWMDFDYLKAKYDAEVKENLQLAYPFYMAKIVKK